MSQPLNIIGTNPIAEPNRVTISGTGFIDITPAGGGLNGWVLTDLNFVPINAASTNTGINVSLQIGVATAGFGFFIPFLTYEYINPASTVGGNVAITYGAIQRSFGSGMILQSGYPHIAVNTTVFANSTGLNFTLDLSGNYY